MIKKVTKYWLFTLAFVGFISSFCFWWLWGLWWSNTDTSFPYWSEETEVLKCDNSTDLWNCTSINEDKDGWKQTIIRRLLEVFWLDTSHERDLKFIDYAKVIVNMALKLIAFIALIMTIYTFCMVMFSGNEEGIKKAKWNLVGIFIALGIIWLAWLVVSFIFWWYQGNWKANQGNLSNSASSISLSYGDETPSN